MEFTHTKGRGTKNEERNRKQIIFPRSLIYVSNEIKEEEIIGIGLLAYLTDRKEYILFCYD